MMPIVLPECSPSVFEFPLLADMEKQDAWSASLECVLPCVVVSKNYNRKTHEVEVLPLVKYQNSNGYSDRPTIYCTVWRPFFSNYFIDFPIKEGDTGWVIASDRGTDIVKQSCRPKSLTGSGHCDPQVQNSENTHQYRWGLFIPDRWGETGDGNVGDALAQDDITNGRFVLQSADSKQRISIGHEDIKVVSTNGTASTTLVIKDGTVTMSTSSSVKVTCPTVTYDGPTAFKIDGTLEVTGATTLKDTLSVDKDTTILGKLDVKGKIKETDANITLSTHTHTGNLGAQTSAPTTGT